MRSAGLAWRSLVRQPARAVLGVIGIAAVGALLFDMLLLSRGLLVSFRDLIDSIGYDVRVTATRALPEAGPRLEDAERLLATIRSLPEVDDAVPFVFGAGELLGPEGGRLALSLLGSARSARGSWTLLRGAGLDGGAPAEGLREEAPRVVINRLLAEEAGLAPGDRIRLAGDRPGLAPQPPVSFVVAGIAAFPFDAQTERTALITLARFHRLFGEEDPPSAHLLLVASRPGVRPAQTVAAVSRALPGLHVFSNDELASRFGGEDFSYFRQISFVLTCVTLLFAFLLVTTLLTVSVNQRFGEIAALRALGFRRRRVVADLLYESLLLVAAGGLLSLPLGAGLALWLDGVLREMAWIPERLHFFVFEVRSVGLHVALLAVTGLLATLYPVLLAARLPIAATLRREVVG